MLSWTQTLLRVGLSLLLAFPIGWERERGHKTAGLRTHLLVSLGCTLFTLISIDLAKGMGAVSDPTRIAAQVVTGIGFLGGGAILRAGGILRGVTTAASIWTVAAIGMACGAGYLAGALVGSLGTYLVLVLIYRWEKRFVGDKRPMGMKIRVRGDPAVARARETIESLGIRPDRVSIDTSGGDRLLSISGAFSPQAVSLAFEELSQDPDVLGIEREDR